VQTIVFLFKIGEPVESLQLTISKISPLIDVSQMENITELQPSMKLSSVVKWEGNFLNAHIRAKEITVFRAKVKRGCQCAVT